MNRTPFSCLGLGLGLPAAAFSIAFGFASGPTEAYAQTTAPDAPGVTPPESGAPSPAPSSPPSDPALEPLPPPATPAASAPAPASAPAASPVTASVFPQAEQDNVTDGGSNSSSAKEGVRIVVHGGAGYALGRMTLPKVSGNRLEGPLLELGIAAQLSPNWAVGLDYTNIEMPIELGDSGFGPSSDGLFGSSLKTLAASSRPNGSNSGLGGVISALPLQIHTFTARAEVTPFGRDGLFAAMNAGVGLVSSVDSRAGAAGSARVGYRLRFADAAAATVEGGAQGTLFEGGSAVLPYVSANLALRFKAFR